MVAYQFSRSVYTFVRGKKKEWAAPPSLASGPVFFSISALILSRLHTFSKTYDIYFFKGLFDSNVFVYTSSFFLQNFLFKEAPAMTNFLGKWSFSSSGGVCGLPVASKTRIYLGFGLKLRRKFLWRQLYSTTRACGGCTMKNAY